MKDIIRYVIISFVFRDVISVLDVLFKTNISKLNDEFNPRDLRAGIIYNNKGEAIDKILFYKKNHMLMKFGMIIVIL